MPCVGFEVQMHTEVQQRVAALSALQGIRVLKVHFVLKNGSNTTLQLGSILFRLNHAKLMPSDEISDSLTSYYFTLLCILYAS